MDISYEDHLQVFFGQASHAEAYVYVELAGMDTAGLEITGNLHGPHSRFAHTLPATIPLRASDSGSTLLAQAIIPDPCFWLPEAPYRYTARIEMCRNGESVFQTQREFGIRPLAAQGTNLMLLGKRWVLRGAGVSQPTEQCVTECRGASACLVSVNAEENVYRQASEQGVVVVAEVANECENISAELARLSRYPAVGMAILPETVADINRSPLPRNLLLGQQVTADAEVQPSAWADVLLMECREADGLGERVASCQLPVIAYRSDASVTTVSEARRACDALQRDLAPVGDFAGYVINL